MHLTDLFETSEPIQCRLERNEHGWQVVASIGGTEVGRATVGKARDGEGYSVMDVFVNPDFRRLGVGTAMYDHAFRSGFAPLRPDRKQSPDGSAFWHRAQTKKIRLGKPMPPMEWGKLRDIRKPRKPAPEI